MSLQGKKVLVVGTGKSGIAATELLTEIRSLTQQLFMRKHRHLRMCRLY